MLLVNPNAGKGGFRQSLGPVSETLYRGGYLPNLFFTDGPKNATEIIATEASKFDMVVCLGGDGTLSEVCAGMVCLDKRPPIGYIPLGTANDIATTLALPRNPVEAAQRVLTGQPVSFDIGKFNDSEYFAYIAAFGAFTEVSYETPQESKQALGQLAYVLHGALTLSKLTHYIVRVEHDEGVFSADLAFGGVTNSTSIAGMLRLDDQIVSLGDGLFEVVLVRSPRNLIEMNNIISDLFSMQYNSNQVIVLQSKKVRFTFTEPATWTRDGDPGGTHMEVVLENKHGAVDIIA